MKVLFYTVPVGSIIRFNGCKAEKLSETHVRFLEDADGNPIDYSKPEMQRYAYSTCEAIGGTPVEVLSEPVCQPCRNRGWLVAIRADDRNAVERCDECQRFASEEAAVHAIAAGVSCDTTYPCYTFKAATA